jgi:beta-aspartyl-peptidase (threonine type)
LLVGEGASSFAFQNGFKMIATENLLVGRERKLYEDLKKKKKVRIKSFFEDKSVPSDTVGAVALDRSGNIVAGTSTGGTPFKVAGRVGDSPIPGSGFYADSRCGGASSTGWGEGIIRVQLARTAIDYLLDNKSPKEAAIGAINRLYQDVSGNGGVILINSDGQWGFYHNTPYMAVGVVDEKAIQYLSMRI